MKTAASYRVGQSTMPLSLSVSRQSLLTATALLLAASEKNFLGRVLEYTPVEASAVATQEATDEDSNTLLRRIGNDVTVAIRKPGKPGNGYRNFYLPCKQQKNLIFLGFFRHHRCCRCP